MPEYRRAFVPGGTFFFTLVTHNRQPIFGNPANADYLRESMRDVQSESPFSLSAAVILPDHLHLLMALPPGDSDYSRRIGQIKIGFTKRVRAAGQSEVSALSTSRDRHREADIWQRRFWEHTIRDETDLANHVDYIHYNPVKHGLVACPHAWPASSFERWVKTGAYERNWCCCCGNKKKAVQPYPSELDDRVGE